MDNWGLKRGITLGIRPEKKWIRPSGDVLGDNLGKSCGRLGIPCGASAANCLNSKNMLKRLRQRWAPLDHLNDEDLSRALFVAKEARRVRVLGEMAARGMPEFGKFGANWLEDPTPGVRRAAARVLGVCGAPTDLGLLGHRLRSERCTSVKLALAVAALRLGAEEGEVQAALETHGGLSLAGAHPFAFG